MITNISAKIQNYSNSIPIQNRQFNQKSGFTNLAQLNKDTVSFRGKTPDNTSLLQRVDRLRALKSKTSHKVVVISGPSGVGKDTIIEALRKKGYELQTTVSYTTRKPRSGEIDGVHYHFISQDQYDAMEKNGEFFETNRLKNGTCYGGTPAETELKRMGHDVVLNISADAAPKIKGKFGKDAVLIYIDAPSEDEVIRRLINRGTETAESLAVRLEYNKEQAKYIGSFDKVIINDKLDLAVKKTLQYLKSRQSDVVKNIDSKIAKLLARLK